MNYTNFKEIGRGGMGAVYKAQDMNGNPVAIKMMSNKVTCHPEYVNLFYNEVDTLRKLNHPSIVHIVDNPYQDNDGNYYLPMEFVDGSTLRQYVSDYGKMDVPTAVDVMCKVLDAMQYVHNSGKIHRDIKPANIMLRKDGSVCIIDFGIAKDARIGGGHTVGTIIGTDGYMSPEQADGMNIDTRTDIYSLGCVFYFLLTGRDAVETVRKDNGEVDNHATMIKVLNGVDVNLPPSLDKVFKKAVNKDMTKRYQTAEEFSFALQCLGSVPTVTVGRGSDCDIVINSEYVSRHHLMIKGLKTPHTGPGYFYEIEIKDDSTNGTGVGGRFLHKDSMNVPFFPDKSLDSQLTELPEIMLSGRAELKLDWRIVINILKKKNWYDEPKTTIDKTNGSSSNNIVNDNANNNIAEEDLDVVKSVLSFIIPLVGIIFAIIYTGKKAQTAKKLCIYGFLYAIFCGFLSALLT